MKIEKTYVVRQGTNCKIVYESSHRKAVIAYLKFFYYGDNPKLEKVYVDSSDNTATYHVGYFFRRMFLEVGEVNFMRIEQ